MGRRRDGEMGRRGDGEMTKRRVGLTEGILLSGTPRYTMNLSQPNELKTEHTNCMIQDKKDYR